MTTTSTAKEPLAYAGVTAVKLVALLTVTLVAGSPPKLTVVVGVKPLPVSVTKLPPVMEPVAGLMPLNVGAFTV